MNKISKLLSILIIVSAFFHLYAEEKPQNKFNVNIQYSQTSGFIPAIDILWHYNDTLFSSLYGNHHITAEKKKLEKYENSKYALFSKTFAVGSDILGFYAAKQPALFAVSAGIEYKRIKEEEFGFFDMENEKSVTTVTFDDVTLLDMVFPFVKLRIDKYSKQFNNRFLFVFYPTYCLFLNQKNDLKPILEHVYESSSQKWQVPAIEISDELLFNFSTFGGILLNGAFSFWQAEYKLAVPQKSKELYVLKKVIVNQTVFEYSATLSYVIPLEIIGGIRPKIGIGVSGGTELRVNNGQKSTHNDIGYLLVFGFYY